MWSSRLFRVSLFLENASILMIWGCFSIVSNVIRSNYCCRRHTMHGNMVFSRDFIFPTPQQSGCLCVYVYAFISVWAYKLSVNGNVIQSALSYLSKSYLVIICSNAHEKLTKIEIRSSWSLFEYCSESLVYPIGSICGHYLPQFGFI